MSSLSSKKIWQEGGVLLWDGGGSGTLTASDAEPVKTHEQEVEEERSGERVEEQDSAVITIPSLQERPVVGVGPLSYKP